MLGRFKGAALALWVCASAVGQSPQHQEILDDLLSARDKAEAINDDVLVGKIMQAISCIRMTNPYEMDDPPIGTEWITLPATGERIPIYGSWDGATNVLRVSPGSTHTFQAGRHIFDSIINEGEIVLEDGAVVNYNTWTNMPGSRVLGGSPIEPIHAQMVCIGSYARWDLGQFGHGMINFGDMYLHGVEMQTWRRDGEPTPLGWDVDNDIIVTGDRRQIPEIPFEDGGSPQAWGWRRFVPGGTHYYEDDWGVQYADTGMGAAANLSQSIVFTSADPANPGHKLSLMNAREEFYYVAHRDFGRDFVGWFIDPVTGLAQKIGRYPLHNHHMGAGPLIDGSDWRSIYIGCTFDRGGEWGPTFHHTDFCLFQDCVVSNMVHDGLVFEDTERGNVVANNLFLGMEGQPITPPNGANPKFFDEHSRTIQSLKGHAGTGVWATTPTNTLTNNEIWNCRQGISFQGYIRPQGNWAVARGSKERHPGGHLANHFPEIAPIRDNRIVSCGMGVWGTHDRPEIENEGARKKLGEVVFENTDIINCSGSSVEYWHSNNVTFIGGNWTWDRNVNLFALLYATRNMRYEPKLAALDRPTGAFGMTYEMGGLTIDGVKITNAMVGLNMPTFHGEGIDAAYIRNVTFEGSLVADIVWGDVSQRAFNCETYVENCQWSESPYYGRIMFGTLRAYEQFGEPERKAAWGGRFYLEVDGQQIYTPFQLGDKVISDSWPNAPESAKGQRVDELADPPLSPVLRGPYIQPDWTNGFISTGA